MRRYFGTGHYFCSMRSSYKGNIFRLYIIKTAKWFSLIMPVIVLFFQENGLNMTQIFALKSVYSIGILVFEIPSGYFGDVWGRKKTLILGSILTTVGFSIYGFAFSFWQFMIAELVLGIGQSFISGADSAMLFDSLKAMDKENEYLKYEGRVISLGNFSEAAAGILGSLLAMISLRTPFVVQAIFSSAAIPAAITLCEPPIELRGRVKGFVDILKVVKYAMIDNKRLSLFILQSAVIGAATLTYAWFVQPYFLAIKLPLALYGTMWTLLNLTVAASSFFSHKVQKALGKRNTMLFIVISTALGFILTGTFISVWALPLLFFFYISRGIATPVLKEYIHVLIDSDIRATILSIRDMFIRIFFAIIGPILGWLTDNFSLTTALIVSGIIFMSMGFMTVLPVIWSKRNL
jgi:MFS family permease